MAITNKPTLILLSIFLQLAYCQNSSEIQEIDEFELIFANIVSVLIFVNLQFIFKLILCAFFQTDLSSW